MPAHHVVATENESDKKIDANAIEHEADGDDEDEDKDDVSPSPAMQIEIMVRGEPDNGGVQSEGGNFPQSDETSDDVWFSIYIHFISCSVFEIFFKNPAKSFMTFRQIY